jgi:hypothetical protein
VCLLGAGGTSRFPQTSSTGPLRDWAFHALRFADRRYAPVTGVAT